MKGNQEEWGNLASEFFKMLSTSRIVLSVLPNIFPRYSSSSAQETEKELVQFFKGFLKNNENTDISIHSLRLFFEMGLLPLNQKITWHYFNRSKWFSVSLDKNYCDIIKIIGSRIVFRQTFSENLKKFDISNKKQLSIHFSKVIHKILAGRISSFNSISCYSDKYYTWISGKIKKDEYKAFEAIMSEKDPK